MKIHVVVVHWNSPLKLVRTLLVFAERKHDCVEFYLIDNMSRSWNFLMAVAILKLLTARSCVIQRANVNREAGGYWHYINHCYDKSVDLVVFTQDELHQRGMRPKGVPKANDSARQPYYPEKYGVGGVSLLRCERWISENPLDEIGFGGRRCRFDVDYDQRFANEYWKARWQHLDLAWYDFFSGACFCVGREGVEAFRRLAEPTEADLANRQFAWMWERMWGTVLLAAGGKLVHYETQETDRVEEHSDDVRRDPQLVSKSRSRKLSDGTDVRRRTLKA